MVLTSLMIQLTLTPPSCRFMVVLTVPVVDVEEVEVVVGVAVVEDMVEVIQMAVDTMAMVVVMVTGKQKWIITKFQTWTTPKNAWTCVLFLEILKGK